LAKFRQKGFEASSVYLNISFTITVHHG